ncbi:MAG: hypothetical protein HY054_14850 [Proteobacteria bacterium]|nr:hypothetical protein [Pseudomonadota bacterium]
MQKFIIPLVAGFATAFAINFLMSFASAAAGEKGDNTGLYVGIAMGAIVALIFFNLSGNRSTAAAGAEAKQRALAFTPTPGKAALYLVRTGFVGKLAGMNLAVDGREVAQLRSPRFARVDVAPGAHTLRASFGGGLAGQTKASELAFTCADSEIVVMKLSMGMGVVQNPLKIERSSADAVRGELAGMQMTAPDVAAV